MHGQSRLLALLAAFMPWGPVHAGSPQPPASTVTHTQASVEWQGNGLLLEVTALRDDIVRIRIAPNSGHLPEDASWAVLPTARQAHVCATPTDDAHAVGFATRSLKISINRLTSALSITDDKGTPLLTDRGAPALLPSDRHGFTLIKTLPDDGHFFGLGDKFGPLDRLGKSYAMWNTDSYGYREGQDPLYKDIPFFIGYTHHAYYGVFVDNTWRTFFDFGHEDPSALQIKAEDGPIDYYVMAGPDAKSVEQQYAWLTGPPAMQPEWMLGFQQSRWGYPTETALRDIGAHLRADHVPTDAVWMDIDYQDRFRPFTVDPATFAHFHQMIADFAKTGIHTVAITDLHIADAPHQGYAPYDSGMAQDRFVKDASGRPYIAPVWPGPSLFPDFTQAATRAWWGQLYRHFALEDGIAGFWNDMDEPAVFDTPTKTMPLNTVHRIDEPGFVPRTASHREIHNIYGMQNHRATYEGLLALKPDARPVVMTRASYAGGQRYGVTWTGDNASTWNHLALSVPMLESLGLGGFTFSGADIGGFAGVTSPDLLTRWYEIAMFTPIARSHADKDSGPQEPWADGRMHEDIRRHFIETRYRLLPYNYTLAEEASRTGIPMMRPLFMEFPDTLIHKAPMDLASGNEFMWGAALLVAPSPAPESPAPYRVTLPPGQWYDYWTGQPVTTAQALVLKGAAGSIARAEEGDTNTAHELKVAPRLDQLPVYVRGGSIIPQQPLVQSTMQTPGGPLTLHVYPGGNCQGSVYADDGQSFDFRKQAYNRVRFRCQIDQKGGLSLTVGPTEGTFQPWWHAYAVVIHGRNAPHAQATFNGTTLPVSVADTPIGHGLMVTIPATEGSLQVNQPIPEK
ncbi:TIM-barrel domain-containing protein [Komagataeibacter xylinus]|uniref:DUF5110 domain-containing protein n=1 Tax=Komagataeibacter xylinus TaxID=28448 RepID=A0A857FNP9_KOMXY|nr:TIM-barrel domain-containing protein [Komagataeibacter xylinus]QHC34860.1 DUF5110 domain-containing protein [Komagataeibacter xylinus]